MNRNCEDKKANGRKGKMLRLMATCHPSLSLQGCWVLITINTMKYNYIIMLAEKSKLIYYTFDHMNFHF